MIFNLYTWTQTFYNAINEQGYNTFQQVEGLFSTNDTTLVDIGIPIKITKVYMKITL